MLTMRGSHQPVSVIVAESDEACRQKVRALLEAEPDFEIVEECTQVAEIIAALEAHKPDLLLLEPRMPGGNVFDFLRPLPPDGLPLIIFATSQDQYALKAFEINAFDFILKPFDAERLHSAIARARFDLARRREDATLRWRQHVRHVKANPSERLVVKLGSRAVFLRVGEVDWIEAAANYVKIHAGNEEYRAREAIGQVEKRVAGYGLARIHRSAIVNVAKIKEVSACNSGEYMIRLKNGKELPCSRSYNSPIRKLLESFGTRRVG